MPKKNQEPLEGYCTQCGAELLADLCPTPGCFGLPLAVINKHDRLNIEAAESSEAARSLLPYLSGQEKKFDYMALRYSGFSMREAIQMAQVTQHQLTDWRALDPKFRFLESELSGPHRKEIRREITSLVFLRNFHMALRKDAHIFKKSLEAEDTDQQLNDQEHKYLLEARKHYTVQQMDALDRVVGVGDESRGEFEEIMLRVRRYTPGIQEVVGG